MLAIFDNLGFSELLIVVVVAVLIFGKRLPEVAGQAGAQIAKFRRSLQDIKNETGIDNDIRKIQREIQEAVPRDLSVGEMARIASLELEKRMKANEEPKPKAEDASATQTSTTQATAAQTSTVHTTAADPSSSSSSSSTSNTGSSNASASTPSSSDSHASTSHHSAPDPGAPSTNHVPSADASHPTSPDPNHRTPPDASHHASPDAGSHATTDATPHAPASDAMSNDTSGHHAH